MRVVVLTLCLSLISATTGVVAQQKSLFTQGQRVWISACLVDAQGRLRCSDRIIGTVVAEASDSLIIRSEQPDDSTIAVPLNSIDRIQVSTGQTRKTVEGAILGGVVGGIIGAIAALSEPTGTCPGIFQDVPCDPTPPAVGLVTGAAIGAGVGALIGMSIRTDRWEEIPLDQLRVSLAPQRDGPLVIGLAVAF